MCSSVASESPQSVNLLESGNQIFTGSSFTQTDTSDYTLTPASSSDCALTTSGSGTLAIGGVCALSAAYTPTTFATTTDTVTFNGNLENASLSTPSSVELTLTGPSTAPASGITLEPFSPVSPVYGQTVTLSAAVSGSAIAPTGSVVFTVGSSTYSAPLVNGTATATASGLNAGQYSVSASYTSTNGYASATSNTATLVVGQASSSISLSANPNPAVQGKLETLTATVTGTGVPAGNVIFLSGSTTLCTFTLTASDVATCTFTPSASGPLALSAQYQGDTNHLASSTSLTLNVYDSAVSLQFSSTQLTYPGATNITACVSGATKATATGTVQILDGTTKLTTLTLGGNGCAYWYISPGLAAGSHSISAVYSGDKNNPAGSSSPTILTVSPVPVNMSVSCWNASFPYGANYQCTVNISSNAGSAQGNLTYSYDGGPAVSVPLSSGNAQFTITEPVEGSQSVKIGYAQQTNYAAAPSQTENFAVTPAPVNFTLSPSTYYTTVGTTVTFSVSVASWSAGPPNDNGAVSFYDGSTLLATVPVNSAGQASYSTSKLPTGQQTITAAYAGGTNYASGSSSATISIVK